MDYDFQLAFQDQEDHKELIADLLAEIERLRAKLMPAHFVTAPEVILYLEDLKDRIDTYVERQQIQATIVTIKRLQDHPKATGWAQPLPGPSWSKNKGEA